MGEKRGRLQLIAKLRDANLGRRADATWGVSAPGSCLSKMVLAGTNVRLSPGVQRLARVKFILVDQLISHEPGKRLVMAKNVSMAEEYLADHFPQFPVLPGVMMLEAAIQTAAWLVRQQHDFAHSLVVLKEARGVRYGAFVSPGQTLVMTADAVEIGQARSDFKIKGTIGPTGPTAIQARLELAHLNLTDTDAGAQKIDSFAKNAMRERWQTITQRSGTAAAAPALA